MKVNTSYNQELSEMDIIAIQNNIEMTEEIFMGRRSL